MNKDDDKNWKLGMFYYNPDDPSESVERKNGLGSTINFASKTGRLIFVFIPPIMIMLVFIIVMLLK